VDVKVDVFMNDANRLLRLEIPTTMEGQYFGQTMFGSEDLYMDGRECVAQRFVAMRDAECLALFNRGTYGSICKEGVISMTLLRGTAYCAHPIFDRPLIPTDKFVKKIDMGERNYSFRLTTAQERELERLAWEFNMPAYACNVFPVESDVQAKEFVLQIEDRDIVLITMKKAEEQEGYILRLLNNYSQPCETEVEVCGARIRLQFGQYEVKTVLYVDGKLEELAMLCI
jgi:alpha-mannosidase